MSAYAVLKIRDFRFFMMARTCFTLAIHIQAVAVGWQIYEITKDPLSLGLIGLAEAVPAITVALYAGHLADITERKKIILFCSLLLVLCSIGLFYFTIEAGSFIALFGVVPIYSVIFVTGIARGFLQPANFSFMPQLIPRELYTSAITWYSTLWETSSLLGATVAGYLLKWVGISTTYSIVTGLMTLGLFSVMMVTRKPLPTITEEQGMIEKIKTGLKFVFHNQIVLSAISLDLFAVLFGGAVALLPIFANEILNSGAEGFGLLRAAPGFGALGMAIYLTHNPIKKSIGKVLLWCVAGFGMCMIGFGMSKLFWLSFGLLVGSGMFDCVSVVIRGMLIHHGTPENMKGRVAAVNSIFVGSSNEIGAFESGVAAKLMGVVNSVVFGGIMTMLVVGVTAKKANQLVKLEKVG
jgi:MFS family permease